MLRFLIARHVRILINATAVLLLASAGISALAQQSYGIDFATIGAAGNRAATLDEAPDMYRRAESIGAVGYEYRISRTELTNTQWFEFVQAYAPFNQGAPNDGGFTGDWISYQGNGQYRMNAGTENWAANMSWHMAARYCNWLQNGKVISASAFEQGVYDTSTFTRNPNNTWNDNREHAADARFWIPGLDEWAKAAYYDPNKYGAGQEGYWLQPAMSDVPLISGVPGVGETSAGLDPWLHFPVGSYPSVLSPWGLLDTSGGMIEWLGGQLLAGPNSTNDAWYKGSGIGNQFYELQDRLDWARGAQPQFPNGLRIASSIPAPGVFGTFFAFAMNLAIKRRR